MMRPPGRWILFPALAACGWVAGFAWFVHTAWQPPVPPPHADGIVVLTGGADRVEVGFRLLRDDAADRMLVSGVGRDADFHELARRAGMNSALSPRVTLGHLASTTHGNAAETADWVEANHIHSLIVVTAGYHMLRALAELRQTMPHVALIPVTVQPPGMRSARDAGAWRLLAGEYNKYLAVSIGLSGLAGETGFFSGEHGG